MKREYGAYFFCILLLMSFLVLSCTKKEEPELYPITVTVNGVDLNKSKNILPTSSIRITYSFAPQSVSCSLKDVSGKEISFVQSSFNRNVTDILIPSQLLSVNQKYILTINAGWFGHTQDKKIDFQTIRDYSTASEGVYKFFNASGTGDQVVKGEQRTNRISKFTELGLASEWSDYDIQGRLTFTAIQQFDSRFPRLMSHFRQEFINNPSSTSNYTEQREFDSNGLWISYFKKKLDGSLLSSEVRSLTYIGNRAYVGYFGDADPSFRTY